MATSAEDFERAWGSHVRGGAEPVRSELRELVAVAEGLRSFQTAVQAPPADHAWARLSEEIDRQAGASGAVVVPLRRKPPRRRLVLRLAAAAVAVFALLATVSLRATPGSFLYPLRTGLEKTALLVAPHDGSLHLHVAEARLGDLVLALRDGPQAAAPGLARSLTSERSAARAHGASVAQLDAEIGSEMPPALAEAPAGIARQVRTILGSLLPPVDTSVLPARGESGSGEEGPRGGSSNDSGPGSSKGSTGPASGDSGSGSGDQGSEGSSGGGGSGSGDNGGSSSNDQTGGTGGNGGGDTSGDGGSGGGDQGSGGGNQGSGSGSGDAGSGSADGGSGGGGGD
jgi:hypothetical protein